MPVLPSFFWTLHLSQGVYLWEVLGSSTEIALAIKKDFIILLYNTIDLLDDDKVN